MAWTVRVEDLPEDRPPRKRAPKKDRKSSFQPDDVLARAQLSRGGRERFEVADYLDQAPRAPEWAAWNAFQQALWLRWPDCAPKPRPAAPRHLIIQIHDLSKKYPSHSVLERMSRLITLDWVNIKADTKRFLVRGGDRPTFADFYFTAETLETHLATGIQHPTDHWGASTYVKWLADRIAEQASDG